MRLLALLLLPLLAFAAADVAAEPEFEVWLEGVRAEALTNGVRRETVEAALAELAPIPRVIELDRRQPEGVLSYDQYMTRVIPDSRVQRGRELLAQHRPLLEEVASRYGVPAPYMVALWGIETGFGRHTGGFSVIAALATLAHDGRRSDFFRKELMNALRILDEGHIALDDMVGSWAGAMGQCQFMPSSFVNFAVDHDGDGHKDIWSTQADVFASTANYLANSGWQADRDWGFEVRIPDGLDPALVGTGVMKGLAEWQALGVRRYDGSDLPNHGADAQLIMPEDVAGPAFLVHDNFETILKWNRSTFFALAVGQLADRIGAD
ncbi:MAG: lytic murein transglycosylase [Alphaproteobacteria bacterium]